MTKYRIRQLDDDMWEVQFKRSFKGAWGWLEFGWHNLNHHSTLKAALSCLKRARQKPDYPIILNY